MKLIKKIMKAVAVVFTVSLLLCSCQSTKTADSNPVNTDSDYADTSNDEVAVKLKTDNENTDELDSESGDSGFSDVADVSVDADDEYYDEEKSNEKANKKSIFDFLTKSSSKVKEVGTFNLSTKAINSKLKLQEASFYIDNNKYDAGFGSYIMAAYYLMLMDQKGRSIYTNAVNSYFNDFENKKLKRKDKKTYKQYGKAKATIYWGVVKSQIPNYAYPTAYFGYTFKEKSPYFTITIHPTVNEKRRVDDTVVEESMMVTFYFTKAQCRELANFLKEDNLYNYFGTGIPNVEEIVESDEY